MALPDSSRPPAPHLHDDVISQICGWVQLDEDWPATFLSLALVSRTYYKTAQRYIYRAPLWIMLEYCGFNTPKSNLLLNTFKARPDLAGLVRNLDELDIGLIVRAQGLANISCTTSKPREHELPVSSKASALDRSIAWAISLVGLCTGLKSLGMVMLDASHAQRWSELTRANGDTLDAISISCGGEFGRLRYDVFRIWLRNCGISKLDRLKLTGVAWSSKKPGGAPRQRLPIEFRHLQLVDVNMSASTLKWVYPISRISLEHVEISLCQVQFKPSTLTSLFKSYGDCQSITCYGGGDSDALVSSLAEYLDWDFPAPTGCALSGVLLSSFSKTSSLSLVHCCDMRPEKLLEIASGAPELVTLSLHGTLWNPNITYPMSPKSKTTYISVDGVHLVVSVPQCILLALKKLPRLSFLDLGHLPLFEDDADVLDDVLLYCHRQNIDFKWTGCSINCDCPECQPLSDGSESLSL